MSSEKMKFENSKKYGIYIKSILIGLAVTVLFVLLFSLVMLLLNLPYRFAAPFATVSVATGSFAAAFSASRSIGNKGYLIGLAIGIAVFAIITFIALAINKSGITSNTLFHFIIITLASLIGGIMGVNKTKNKKYI